METASLSFWSGNERLLEKAVDATGERVGRLMTVRASTPLFSDEASVLAAAKSLRAELQVGARRFAAAIDGFTPRPDAKGVTLFSCAWRIDC